MFTIYLALNLFLYDDQVDICRVLYAISCVGQIEGNTTQQHEENLWKYTEDTNSGMGPLCCTVHSIYSVHHSNCSPPQYGTCD